MTQGRREIDGVRLSFHGHPFGGPSIIFSIHEGSNRTMAGWLNSPGKALFIDGRTVIVAHKYIADVAIMFWKRGDWEARLFG